MFSTIPSSFSDNYAGSKLVDVDIKTNEKSGIVDTVC